jgi:hypothetical protein
MTDRLHTRTATDRLTAGATVIEPGARIGQE